MDGLVSPGERVDAVAVGIGRIRVRFVGIGAAGVGSSAIPSSESVLVGGTWGDPAPPSIVSATAVDSGRGAGFNSGDSLALVRARGKAVVVVELASVTLAVCCAWSRAL